MISEKSIEYTNKDLKDLKLTISKLSKNEHIEIYRILKLHTNSFTENNNGIFINLSKLNNTAINILFNFVKFRIGCNKFLNKSEINRKKIKNY